MNDSKARGFLDAILTQPDEDAPRLIFADWLEEQGDGARSEFIRVQVERARLPEWDAAQVRLRLRETALLGQYGPKWMGELPTVVGVTWGEFRRGFVSTVTIASFADLRASTRECWAAAPLEAVKIRWASVSDIGEIEPFAGLHELTLSGTVFNHNDEDVLADAPLLSTVRVLNAARCNLGGEGFRRLVASPHLGNLQALRVPLNSIGTGGPRALVNASLPSLTELDISEASNYGSAQGHGRYREDPVIDATDLATLARWRGLAKLRALSLSGNNIAAAGLRALLRSPHVTGLKELTLRANGLDAQAMQEFAKARPGLQLDKLDIGENLVGNVGASDLALAPCLQQLKVLNLDRCEIELSGARWLVNSPFVDTLRMLNVNHNTFGPEGLYRLLEKKPPALHTLEMAANDLGDEGAAYLAEARGLNALLDVNFESNKLSGLGAKYLAKSRQLPNLLALRLNDNRFNAQATTELEQSPLAKRLAVLELVPF